MAYKPYNVPLMTALVEHYLFDLGYPVKKVSEIVNMDEGAVKEIYEERIRCTITTRSAL